MKGDRVKILSSAMFESKDEVLPVYEPVWNSDGSLQIAEDGSCGLKRLGGVKAGTTGVIEGAPIKVHRSQVLHLQSTGASLGGRNDFVEVFPVWLDHYQQRGWFPSDHVRIMAGGII